MKNYLNYPLPSLRTLRRKLENVKFHSGILDEIFSLMSLKVTTLNEFEKDCVLVLHKMFITEGITYDVASKAFIGDVTLLEHQGVATHGLVFMFGGVSSRWKQTVAYYFNGKYFMLRIILQ